MTDLTDIFLSEQPYLRRYARAVLGRRDAADDLVTVLSGSLREGAAFQSETYSPRLEVFRRLQRLLGDALRRGAVTGGLLDMPPMDEATLSERCALLLTTLEGFDEEEALYVLGVKRDEFDTALAKAQASMEFAAGARVLVIEDEPVIAAHLSSILKQGGHDVIGVASTASEAVSLAAGDPPELILADVKLRDGSTGVEAIEAIDAPDVPVVYVTAYPEAVLTGKGAEPAFLVAKPFRAADLRAVVSQALLFAPAQPGR